MNERYKARWTDGHERGLANGANAVIVDDLMKERICFLSPLAMAKRIAFALNLTQRFSDKELEQMNRAFGDKR